MPDFRELVRQRIRDAALVPEREAEIVEELAGHLRDRYDLRLSMGDTPDEALQAVTSELNERELSTDLRRVERMARESIPLGGGEGDSFWTRIRCDLRHAYRALRASPVFTAVCIASLALGIGANTAIFQLIDAVRMRTLPVSNPRELAVIRPMPGQRNGIGRGRFGYMSNPLWEQVKTNHEPFSVVFAWGANDFNLASGGQVRYAHGLYVSGNFFDVLGVQPVIGRTFHGEDDHPGCGAVGAVISDRFWKAEFGGDRDVVGKTLRLEGQPVPVLGVTPASFSGLEIGRNFDLAVPVCFEPMIQRERPLYNLRHAWWLTVMGRLKPGWTLKRASAQLAAVSPAALEQTLPPVYPADVAKEYLAKKLVAFPGAAGLSRLRDDYESPLWLLLAIAGSVLLIACANLANLMLARASAREREIAIRMAMGADRTRILRQLLAECLLLAAGGAVVGTLLAVVLSRLLVSYLGESVFVNLAMDWRVLGFAAALALLTACVFGLMPAWRATQASPARIMSSASRGLTASRQRFGTRKALVVAQVALSLMLVTSALLFSGSLRKVIGVDAGFQSDGLLAMDVDASVLNATDDERFALEQDLVQRVRAIPGISSAADAVILPVLGSGWNDQVIVDGKKSRIDVDENAVSDGFFRTMRTPLLTGRDFDDRDTANSTPVAIVNEAFAQKLLGTNNPLGRTFKIAVYQDRKQFDYQVVGLVKDTKYDNLREDFPPVVYYPQSQNVTEHYFSVVVRTGLPPDATMKALRETAAAINPAIQVDFEVYTKEISKGLLRERLLATLSGFFGVLALLLAVIGLYGVIAYMVTRRTNEIGVRIALGAAPAAILRMVVREGTWLLAIGLGLGLVLTLAVGRAAAALLYGLTARDPLTLTLAALTLAIVAVTAMLIPAFRAAHLDPVTALREE